MKPIFISYSHKDKAYARKLADALEQQGLPVWIDDRIDYGTKWPRILQENLDACGAFLVIMSPRSYESDWVQNELSRAQEKAKPVFPLLLEGDNWLSVQSAQYVDVRDGQLPPARFYDRLAKVLEEQPPGPVDARQKARLSQFRKGELVQGRFKIEARLARGKVLELYRATDVFLGRAVLLCANFVELVEVGFSDEQKSAITYAGMTEPDLPNVQEFFRVGSRHFIVLEARELNRPESVLEWIEGKLR